MDYWVSRSSLLIASLTSSWGEGGGNGRYNTLHFLSSEKKSSY